MMLKKVSWILVLVTVWSPLARSTGPKDPPSLCDQLIEKLLEQRLEHKGGAAINHTPDIRDWDNESWWITNKAMRLGDKIYLFLFGPSYSRTRNDLDVAKVVPQPKGTMSKYPLRIEFKNGRVIEFNYVNYANNQTVLSNITVTGGGAERVVYNTFSQSPKPSDCAVESVELKVQGSELIRITPRDCEALGKTKPEISLSSAQKLASGECSFSGDYFRGGKGTAKVYAEDHSENGESHHASASTEPLTTKTFVEKPEGDAAPPKPVGPENPVGAPTGTTTRKKN